MGYFGVKKAPKRVSGLSFVSTILGYFGSKWPKRPKNPKIAHF